MDGKTGSWPKQNGAERLEAEPGCFKGQGLVCRECHGGVSMRARGGAKVLRGVGKGAGFGRWLGEEAVTEVEFVLSVAEKLGAGQRVALRRGRVFALMVVRA